ncbi:MAG: anti-sigma factor [Saprospiraceae bacterium]|nr:anti-sigma factor [Saprospiraceae bacterium]MCB9325515.1 anti-sigma factor [Lewinellaceae bacterium]
MDIKAYISSGILEEYVLGAASEQERREVECMSHIYPEIKEELSRLQQTIESFAMINAVDPPTSLKAGILEAIDDEAQIKPGDAAAVIPMERADATPETARIIPMYMKLALAASVALLLVFGGLWLTNNNKYQQQIAAAEDQNQNLRDQMATLQTETEARAYTNSLLASSDTRIVEMPGTDNSPDSKVRVYWNTVTREVLLKVDQLPPPEADKQYQLWAIVNGEPQDMGVFEIDAASDQVQLMSAQVENAQAFAITLEKKGGSPTPTLSAMYVLGNV